MNSPRKFIVSAFGLTREEKTLLAMILAVALIGLIARYVYLRGQKPEPYQPAGVPAAAPAHRAEPVEQ